MLERLACEHLFLLFVCLLLKHSLCEIGEGEGERRERWWCEMSEPHDERQKCLAERVETEIMLLIMLQAQFRFDSLFLLLEWTTVLCYGRWWLILDIFWRIKYESVCNWSEIIVSATVCERYHIISSFCSMWNSYVIVFHIFLNWWINNENKYVIVFTRIVT